MPGMDAEEGQSGPSSPHKTMLKSGQTPGMHISLQMARAAFNSMNHKRLPLLIAIYDYIDVYDWFLFIYLFSTGWASPVSLFFA